MKLHGASEYTLIEVILEDISIHCLFIAVFQTGGGSIWYANSYFRDLTLGAVG